MYVTVCYSERIRMSNFRSTGFRNESVVILADAVVEANSLDDVCSTCMEFYQEHEVTVKVVESMGHHCDYQVC